MHIERTSRPGIKNTPVLQLHTTPEDARRRALYDETPVVSDQELRRLWSAAQVALEDLVLALPTMDGMRQSLVTMMGVCRGYGDGKRGS